MPIIYNTDSLYRFPTLKLGLGRTFREWLRGDKGPERKWLFDFLEPRSVTLSELRNSEVSVYDIDSDGRADWEVSVNGRPQRSPSPLAMVQRERPEGTRARIIHVGIAHEDHFDTTTVEALATKVELESEFFLDHFLPSLPCDRKIMHEGEELHWVPPVPSAHRFFRLKDCEGRNISVAFLKSYDESEHTGTLSPTTLLRMKVALSRS
jgi:hypothetical protein